MIKVDTLKKEFEQYLKDNDIQFVNLNNVHKNLSIPMYMLNLKLIDETKGIIMETPATVVILPSSNIMYFDAFNIYHSNKRNIVKTLKIINSMNQIPLPGKFIMDDENYVGYRCMFDYKNIDNTINSDLCDIIDSILPACYLFIEKLNGDNNEGQ